VKLPISCLTDKRPPEAPLTLRHMPGLGRFNSRWRKREWDSLWY